MRLKTSVISISPITYWYKTLQLVSVTAVNNANSMRVAVTLLFGSHFVACDSLFHMHWLELRLIDLYSVPSPLSANACKHSYSVTSVVAYVPLKHLISQSECYLPYAVVNYVLYTWLYSSFYVYLCRCVLSFCPINEYERMIPLHLFTSPQCYAKTTVKLQCV